MSQYKILRLMVVVYMLCWSNVFSVNRLIKNETEKGCKTPYIIQALSHVALINRAIKDQANAEVFKHFPVFEKYVDYVKQLRKKTVSFEGEDTKKASGHVVFKGLDKFDEVHDYADNPKNDVMKAWLLFLKKMPEEVQDKFGEDFTKETKIVYGASSGKEVPEEVKQDGSTWELKSFVAHSAKYVKSVDTEKFDITEEHFYVYGKTDKHKWYLYQDYEKKFKKAQHVAVMKGQEKEVGEKLKHPHGFPGQINSALFTAFRTGWFNEVKEEDKKAGEKPSMTKRSVVLYFYEQVETKSDSLTELQKSLELLKKKLGELAQVIGEIGE